MGLLDRKSALDHDGDSGLRLCKCTDMELSLDDLELGSEIVKVEQNMILGPHVKQKREGSDDSAMTID